MNYLARCAHCIIGRRHSRSGDRPAPLKSGTADDKLVSDWILLVKNRRVRWWDLAGSFLIYLLPLVVLTGCLRLHWRSWERRVFRLPRPARSQVTFLGPEFLAYTDYDGARTEVRVWRAPAS